MAEIVVPATEELQRIPLFKLHELVREAGNNYNRVRKTAESLTGMHGPKITLGTRKNSRATYKKLVERAYAAYSALAEEVNRREEGV